MTELSGCVVPPSLAPRVEEGDLLTLDHAEQDDDKGSWISVGRRDLQRGVRFGQVYLGLRFPGTGDRLIGVERADEFS